jgi:hypothetical protein
LNLDEKSFELFANRDFEGMIQHIEDAVADTLRSFRSPKEIIDDMRAQLCDRPQQFNRKSSQLMLTDF